MRSWTRFAFAATLIGAAVLANPAFSVPLPRERHVPAHHRSLLQPRAREEARTVSPRRGPEPLDLPQVSLSARTSYVMPALVAEARKYMGTNPTDRRRLWCATFMNFILAKLGYAGTNSDAARSFAYYGHRISEPRVGAIAVLTRGRRGGHVGVVSGIDKNGDPIIISGNHNRLVGEAVYSRSRVIAYVMPTEQHAPTRVAAGGQVSVPGAEAGLDSPITELIAAIEAEQARAETPRQRDVRLAMAPKPAPPVPHRLVQQMPDQSRQVQRGVRSIDNPFSELIDTLEVRKPRAL